MESKKKKKLQMKLFIKQKQRHRYRKQTWLHRYRKQTHNWEIGIDIYILLYIKQITNKDLLHSTGNSTQNSILTCMGKESKGGYMYNRFILLYT